MKHKPFNDMPDTEKIKAKKNIDEIFILFFLVWILRLSKLLSNPPKYNL